MPQKETKTCYSSEVSIILVYKVIKKTSERCFQIFCQIQTKDIENSQLGHNTIPKTVRAPLYFSQMPWGCSQIHVTSLSSLYFTAMARSNLTWATLTPLFWCYSPLMSSLVGSLLFLLSVLFFFYKATLDPYLLDLLHFMWLLTSCPDAMADIKDSSAAKTEPAMILANSLGFWSSGLLLGFDLSRIKGIRYNVCVGN